jgi:predicted nuclease with TOPRIM domain
MPINFKIIDENDLADEYIDLKTKFNRLNYEKQQLQNKLDATEDELTLVYQALSEYSKAYCSLATKFNKIREIVQISEAEIG